MKLNLKKNNYVCLFPYLKDFHAIKCTGQVCENVGKVYGKKPYIITYRNDNYRLFKKYCPNTSLVFLKGNLNKNNWIRTLSLIKFILLNANNINILYFYYFPGHSILFPLIGLIYKLLNWYGVLHVRLEADIEDLPNTFPLITEGIHRFNRIRNFIINKFFANIDILGVIDDDNFTLSKNKYFWKIVKNKNVIKLQYNGYIVSNELNNIDYNTKSNTICLAGRLNSKQKGIDIFIKALQYVNLKDWNVVLMGETDDKIQKSITRLCDNKKEFRGKIKLTGYINNIVEYWNILLNSKIFCLPSRNDGIPLVIPDAMARGNVILGSDLFGIKNIATNKGECGFVFRKNDHLDLAKQLQYLIDNENILRELSLKSKKRARKIFRWDKIVKNLQLFS